MKPLRVGKVEEFDGEAYLVGYDLGYKAVKANQPDEPPENPYPHDSLQAVSWECGWDAGWESNE
jgi:hypothetical protein